MQRQSRSTLAFLSATLVLGALIGATPASAAPQPVRAQFSQGEAAQSGLHAWYAARNYSPVWTNESGLNARGQAALRVLSQVGNEGLPPSRYDLRALSNTSDLAALDVAISRAVQTYLHDLRYGAANPAAPAMGFAQLDKAAKARDFASYAASQRPQGLSYRHLTQQLTTARHAGATDAASLKKVQETILALEKLRWDQAHASALADAGLWQTADLAE